MVPEATDSTVRRNLLNGTVHRMENADRAILSSLREIKKEDYSLYVTDDSGLISRIYESVKTASTLNELYENAKSKNYTHARVRREVLNLYLKTERDFSKSTPPYIRILAVNERGLSLLSEAKRKASVPKECSSETARESFSDIFSNFFSDIFPATSVVFPAM